MQRIREVYRLLQPTESPQQAAIPPLHHLNMVKARYIVPLTLKNALGELLQADIAATLTENPSIRLLDKFTTSLNRRLLPSDQPHVWQNFALPRQFAPPLQVVLWQSIAKI